MKKLIFFLCIFLFPLFVHAEEKVYTLRIPANQTKEITESGLSIRDYLLYLNISNVELSDGMRLPVTEENKYYLLDNKYRLLLLKEYNVIEVRYSKKKEETNLLDFTSLDSFLNSSVYNFLLLGEAIQNGDTALRFIKDDSSDVYGKLISKNTEEDLLIINIRENSVLFSYKKDLSIMNNTSFVRKDNTSDKIEYVSILFSNQERVKKENDSTIFSQGLLLFVVIIFLSLLLISIFYKTKRND